MPYQLNSSCCSAAAMQLALNILGVRVGQHKLVRIIANGGDSFDGANEQDVLQALGRIGCTVEVFEGHSRQEARKWLLRWAPRAPLMLCVDSWEHWVTVAGACGKKLWLFDPDPGPWNTAQNGAWPLMPKTILKRWKAARRLRKEGGLYYGIAIVDCAREKASLCLSSEANREQEGAACPGTIQPLVKIPTS